MQINWHLHSMFSLHLHPKWSKRSSCCFHQAVLLRISLSPDSCDCVLVQYNYCNYCIILYNYCIISIIINYCKYYIQLLLLQYPNTIIVITIIVLTKQANTSVSCWFVRLFLCIRMNINLCYFHYREKNLFLGGY